MSAWKRLVLAGLSLLGLGLAPLSAAYAQVKVTSATPSSTYQGTLSLDVVIAGSGFDNSSKAQFFVSGSTNPGGITVKKTVFHTSSEVVATIDVADTATVASFDVVVMLDSGRKGKGTGLFSVRSKSNDPCAGAGLDFPAFTYWQQSGKVQQIFVADSTGVCTRPLYLSTNGYASGSTHVFSYPVAGSLNVGRILIAEASRLYALDFTVSGTALSIGTRRQVFAGDFLGFDLSRDGKIAYIAVMATTGNDSSRIFALDIDTLTNQQVFVGDPDGFVFDALTADASGTTLFVDKSNGVAPDQLLRITLPCSGPCSTAIYTNPPGYRGSANPAASYVADPVLGYPLLAYTDFNGCPQLRFADLAGNLVFVGGQPRYGDRSSWYAGKLLTNGRGPPNGRGVCSATGYVTQIDPSTSAEVRLVQGYDPDGR